MAKKQTQKYYVRDRVLVTFGSLKFEVEVVELRNSFGRVDYLVKPVVGQGETWVTQDSLESK